MALIGDFVSFSLSCFWFLPDYMHIFQEGLARVERRKKWEPKDRQVALENLEKFQDEARTARLGMWQYGDVQSDDEDTAPPVKKTGGRR